MTEKTLTTENIKPALDALRGELAPWPVVAKKQDRLNTAQLNAANSGITSSLVAQIIANTAAIRALESAITGTGLRPLVVASLPAIGTQGILYIVPVTTYDPETDADVVNYSNEYIWIVAPDAPVTEGYYEQVGQTGIVINNGQLTITVNGTSVGTFTANQSGDTTAAITVPTNADYVDRTTDQTVAGVKTFSSTINGTAAKAIADEDGTSIKTGYVNVAGNQTVSGQKTWSAENTYTYVLLTLKHTALEAGVLPTSNQTKRYRFTDKNNVDLGWVQHRVNTFGDSYLEILSTNKFSNGQFSPQGSDVANSLIVGTHSNGERYAQIMSDFFPAYTNLNCNLGTSTNQWKSVYSQTYYYNGTAWGLDKANVWTNAQIIEQSTVAQFKLKNSTMRLGDAVPSGLKTVGSVAFTGSDNYNFGFIDFRDSALGNTFVRILARQKYDDNGNRSASGTTYESGLDIGVLNDTTPYVAPTSNGVAHLGTSTNKWKTLNGVNPGALSLPDYSKLIDISGSIVPPSGESTINYSGGNNEFTPTVDGWLSIRCDGATFLQIYRNSYNCPGTTASRPSGAGRLVVTLPVIKDTTYTIKIETTGTTNIFLLFPCLGNV